MAAASRRPCLGARTIKNWKEHPPMRVVYFDMDTTRPDHLGCYGYHRNTSPNIDRVARQGTTFTNCYTSDSPCLPSRTALFSGRFGIHNGVVGHGGTAARMRYPGDGHGTRPDELPWAMALSRGGVKTVTFTTFAQRHLAWYFYAGWDEMHRHSQKTGNEIASEVNSAVVPWLRDHGAQDSYFLHINYWDPHTPYRTPLDYGNPFESDPPPDWPTQDVLDAHWESYGAMSSRDRSRLPPAGTCAAEQYPRIPRQLRTRDDFKQWIDGYDTGIRYMDDHVGQVLETLGSLGVLDDTAIIFSADHGENQGELNVYGDHQTADHCTNRVPLIVRWPGVTTPGTRVDALVYQQDLPPAVCELFGVTPPARWDGQSLAPALRGESFDGRPYLVVGHGAHTCQRGVRSGPWMSIRTYHPGLNRYPDAMVFNLDDDPRETNNLAEQRPDILAECDSLLATWWQQMLRPPDALPDPLITVAQEGGPWYVRGRYHAFLQGLRDDGQAWAADEIVASNRAIQPATPTVLGTQARVHRRR